MYLIIMSRSNYQNKFSLILINSVKNCQNNNRKKSGLLFTLTYANQKMLDRGKIYHSYLTSVLTELRATQAIVLSDINHPTEIEIK